MLKKWGLEQSIRLIEICGVPNLLKKYNNSNKIVKVESTYIDNKYTIYITKHKKKPSYQNRIIELKQRIMIRNF